MEWADVEMELDASGHEDLSIWCNDEVARMRGALMLARAAHISRTWDDVALAAIDSALTPNDRVEGRDAASSRRVPSHDGLCGNGNYNERTDK